MKGTASRSWVIIYNFHVQRVTIFPPEAEAPLIVYADAVLPQAVAAQRFQAVAGWNPQVIKAFRSVQHEQFFPSATFDACKFPDEFIMKQPLGMFAAK